MSLVRMKILNWVRVWTVMVLGIILLSNLNRVEAAALIECPVLNEGGGFRYGDQVNIIATADSGRLNFSMTDGEGNVLTDRAQANKKSGDSTIWLMNQDFKGKVTITATDQSGDSASCIYEHDPNDPFESYDDFQAQEKAIDSVAALKLCKKIESFDTEGKCQKCEDGGGMWTAIGCINTNPMVMVKTLLDIALGVGGLLLFMQIVVGATEIIFGSGDPARIQSAQKRITNSLIALLFVIFAATILQIVAINILKIPGFFN